MVMVDIEDDWKALKPQGMLLQGSTMTDPLKAIEMLADVAFRAYQLEGTKPSSPVISFQELESGWECSIHMRAQVRDNDLYLVRTDGSLERALFLLFMAVQEKITAVRNEHDEQMREHENIAHDHRDSSSKLSRLIETIGRFNPYQTTLFEGEGSPSLSAEGTPDEGEGETSTPTTEGHPDDDIPF